ncbi:hypothetical protein NDU88_001469 [Pleurodeles waltl]|uniref:Uncharacterized protein n=1 Tax=Pleurodeles waltl TaxID=8319 RepID=A0AAV7Q3X7_PLEWA|nr:hypothetical protein NDU88_001469 [Pleurodeles waltl]
MHGRLRLGKGAGKYRPRKTPSGAFQSGKCCVVMGGDRTDRSGLRARCKHGRLRLGKGAGKARIGPLPAAPPSAGSAELCGVLWES